MSELNEFSLILLIEQLRASRVLAQDIENNKVELPDAGICANTYNRFINIVSSSQHDELLHVLFNTWDKFSGVSLYPVPDPSGDKSPAYIYNDRLDVYEGEYGQLRVDLLMHCIAVLEEHLVDYKDLDIHELSELLIEGEL